MADETHEKLSIAADLIAGSRELTEVAHRMVVLARDLQAEANEQRTAARAELKAKAEALQQRKPL